MHILLRIFYDRNAIKLLWGESISWDTPAAHEKMLNCGFYYQVMLDEGVANMKWPMTALGKPSNLARAANRHHQKKRPAEPTDLQFKFNKDFIPNNFLKTDIEFGKEETVFATE